MYSVKISFALCPVFLSSKHVYASRLLCNELLLLYHTSSSDFLILFIFQPNLTLSVQLLASSKAQNRPCEVWRTDWRTEISRLKMIVCISCDNFVFSVKIYQVDNVLKLLFSTAGQIRQEMTWPFVSLDFSSFSPKTLSTCEILSHCLGKCLSVKIEFWNISDSSPCSLFRLYLAVGSRTEIFISKWFCEISTAFLHS